MKEGDKVLKMIVGGGKKSELMDAIQSFKKDMETHMEFIILRIFWLLKGYRYEDSKYPNDCRNRFYFNNTEHD